MAAESGILKLSVGKGEYSPGAERRDIPSLGP